MGKVEIMKGALVCIIILLNSCADCQKRQKRQFELSPDLPSHLPAPPKPAKPKPPTESGSGQPDGSQQGPLPIPPPQNVPPGPFGLGVLPGDVVPFGLNHIILIIVPQFKTKYRKLPHWVASSVKVAMPITVFFDQLDVPPGMLIPGPGGLPLPLGIPPSRPSGLIPPVSSVPPSSFSAATPYVPMNPSYGYYPQRTHLYEHGYDGDPAEDPNAEGYDNDDNNYAEEDGSLDRRRRKREACLNHTISTRNSGPKIPKMSDHGFVKRNKRAVRFDTKVHKSERASIIPKLEKILNNAGLEGKPCLLRAICEVHEAPLDHYGLMGEILTMLFSISRSVFAESHLPEYFLAEESGKIGDCAEFRKQCENTLFS